MFWFVLIALFIIVGPACLVFWVWMLVDCIQKKEFYTVHENGQLVWILILLFGGVIGAALYYVLEKRKAPRQTDRMPKPGERNSPNRV
jgi:prolipoprotein diacylglyceryltransferase